MEEEMTIYEVVDKWIGDIHACGDAKTDVRNWTNLKEMEFLVNCLVFDICQEACRESTFYKSERASVYEARKFLKNLFYAVNQFDDSFDLIPQVDLISFTDKDGNKWQGAYDHKKGKLMLEGGNLKMTDIFFELDKEHYGKSPYGAAQIITYHIGEEEWVKKNNYRFPMNREDVDCLLI